MKKLIATPKNLVILGITIIFLVTLITIKPSYAKFTEGYTTEDNIAEFNYDFNLTTTNVEEYEIVKLNPNSYTIFKVAVNNDTKDKIYYGIWYKMVKDNNNIKIAKYTESEESPSGEVDSTKTKTITLIAINNTSSIARIKIGVASSVVDTNTIEYLGGKKLINSTLEKPNLSANSPNLDSGMIPVAYNDKTDTWVVADVENNNDNWYNYDDQKWANAILVKNGSSSKYQNAKVGTSIIEEDIQAFYVWIPRFKYHVWNPTRSLKADYTYDAYNKGIEIKWENGLEKTGNLTCSYKQSASDELNDKCLYNGTDIIKTDDDNKKYQDVWYTHPAFSYGDKELTGFWVGKFETTGTPSNPTILPDKQSLVGTNMATQFNTSLKFQNYNLTANLEAHMLKNTEWGAIAYLTHSIYGLCSESNCRDVYINNSSSLYTGRSGGAEAGSSNLNMNKNYKEANTNTSKYNTSGYYNYQGYLIDYQGKLTNSKYPNKVASTTANIYGVYDLVGGSSENVLANAKTAENKLNAGNSGNTWPLAGLSDKYYNSYTNTDDAQNKSILGDAMAENTIFQNNTSSTWTKATIANINNSKYPWITRGGKYFEATSNLFSYNNYDGSANTENGFRSSLS